MITDFISNIIECSNCANLYCESCNEGGSRGWGNQCPKCQSRGFKVYTDICQLLIGPEWWGWTHDGKSWETGNDSNKSTYEKMD